MNSVRFRSVSFSEIRASYQKTETGERSTARPERRERNRCCGFKKPLQGGIRYSGIVCEKIALKFSGIHCYVLHGFKQVSVCSQNGKQGGGVSVLSAGI